MLECHLQHSEKITMFEKAENVLQCLVSWQRTGIKEIAKTWCFMFHNKRKISTYFNNCLDYHSYLCQFTYTVASAIPSSASDPLLQHLFLTFFLCSGLFIGTCWVLIQYIALQPMAQPPSKSNPRTSKIILHLPRLVFSDIPLC